MKTKTKEFNFKNAKRVGDKFKNAEVKVSVTLRLDPPVIQWLKNESHRLGLKYQTLMNVLLTEAMTASEKNELSELRSRLDAIERKVG